MKYVYILKEYMLFIVHCYPNDYFCFLQIRQNMPAYVNRKGINQKFWSILNLLHSFTSYLFNKKNSGIAGGFEVMFRQSPRNQEAYSESCRAFKSDLQTELITKNSILYNWQGSLIRLWNLFYNSIWFIKNLKDFTRLNWANTEVSYVFL